ncbi:LrgB family protein [Pusillimonas sp. CC-YST705]|uniref:LrgB family protein n=1 Tax=Mesopusillimonas faecipullorum TaxID=2755040 RepID=A0ABS8CAZ2_9BURK|nr:LrgB family protein [Mesopusillimonas faecipullorum]MCB5363201.1 LrgB family protein [Mesopusillimonas faecipullorum]
MSSWALTSLPLFWTGVTLLVYLFTLTVYRRCGSHPLLLPVLTSVAIIIALLYATDTPYPVYAEHTRFLTLLIGPATVALAVPLYGQWGRLKRLWQPLLVALLAGSVTAIVSAVGIAWWLGASLETVRSLAPRAATMPIAMDVAAITGGLPSFTNVAVAMTGVSGAMFTFGLLRLVGVRDPAVQGFAMGLSAHAIGTARAFQENDTAGAFSALGMGLNGIATALLVPLILMLWGL